MYDKIHYKLKKKKNKRGKLVLAVMRGQGDTVGTQASSPQTALGSHPSSTACRLCSLG